DAAERRGKSGRNELVHEPAGLGQRERIEPEQRPVALPAGMIVDELRASSDQEQQRPRGGCEPAREDVQQILLSPVHVLDEHNGRSIRDELAEKDGPGVVKPVACREGVEVWWGLQPERQSQDRARAETAADG